MEVTWEIYTVSGRRVWRQRQQCSAGPQSMAWDGRDTVGDEIANGVYLYVLRGVVTVPGAGSGTGGDAREIRHTGQVVMMR
jgi:flagellar hook assembly protein FlgD